MRMQFAWSWMLVLPMATVLGCSSVDQLTQREPDPQDPLRGWNGKDIPRPPANAKNAADGRIPPTSTASGRTQPPPGGATLMPPTSSAAEASTASLAAGSRPPHSLAIDQRSAAAGQTVNQVSWQTNSSVLSLEQAWQQLKNRGVSWQQLEFKDGQWHFRCSIPNPADANLTRFYEAQADDDLLAVKRVIDRIDSEKQSQNWNQLWKRPGTG